MLNSVYTALHCTVPSIFEERLRREERGEGGEGRCGCGGEESLLSVEQVVGTTLYAVRPLSIDCLSWDPRYVSFWRDCMLYC